MNKDMKKVGESDRSCGDSGDLLLGIEICGCGQSHGTEPLTCEI